jgi:hypothetical protein
MLQFRNVRHITLDNYELLPEIFHLQMGISARLGFGEEFSTAVDFLEESEGEVELWDIVDTEGDGEPIYDCWVYLADTANVFHHATDIDTGVGMIQFSFECLKGKDADCKALAAEIQQAFDGRNAIEEEEFSDL